MQLLHSSVIRFVIFLMCAKTSECMTAWLGCDRRSNAVGTDVADW